MQYKRILMSCLIVILILCTSVLAIGAANETAPFELAVEVTSSTAVSEEPLVLNAGDSFEVSISINNNPGVRNIYTFLTYDTDAFELDANGAYALTELGTKLGVKVTPNAQGHANAIRVSILSDEAFTDNGALVTLKFKVKAAFHGTADKFAFAIKEYQMPNDNTVIDGDDFPAKFNTDTVIVHKFGAGVVTEPTCTDGGYTTYTCTFAGCEDATHKSAFVNALDHLFASTYTTDVPSTCIKKGSESRHCTRTDCDATTDSRELDFANHTYGEWKVESAATCIAKGTEKRTCTVEGCTAYETREIALADHSYETEWTIDKKATCKEEGSKSYHCSVCEDKKDVTVIEKTAHTFGDWTVTTEATCTEKGSEKRTCSACGEAETREIAVKAHTSANYEDVEATKDSVGYTGGTYCSVCQKELTPRTEIPMLEDYTWVYILVAVVVVVAIGGGVCAYFFVFKKKKAAK